MLHGFKMLRGVLVRSAQRVVHALRLYMFHVSGRPSCASYAWRKPYLKGECRETEAAPTKGV